MIKKIFLNFNINIISIAGINFFVKYVIFTFFNIFKIFELRNLDALNNKFKKLSLNFYKENFYFDIKGINDLSGEQNSFGLIREIFFKNIYLKNFKILNPKRVSCIDLGCNIGVFSLLASKIFKEVKSIDVNKKYIAPFKKIMDDNNINNSEFFNYFIGNSPFHEEIKKNYVEKIDLNNFIILNNLKNIFLKIDIEGYEFQIIETLDFKNISALSMEIHQSEGNIEKIIKKISDNKFNYILNNDLSEIVKDKEKATYIFAVKENSDINLNI